MKKHYISVFGVFIGLLASLANTSLSTAQSMPAFSSYTLPATPSGWEASYESWQYSSPLVPGYNLRFRLMKPNGWTAAPSTDKYPIIVFFHGSGEIGSGDPTIQDNKKQLVHGGEIHRNAVLNGTFPGFLLYPQMRRTGPLCNEPGGWVCGAPNWNEQWEEAVRYVLDKLIVDYKVDPNRIYVHGLSGGGEATWQFITSYPEYVAAAHPMSAAGDDWHANVFGGNKEYYKHIPLWSSQGGTDQGPTPLMGNTQVSAIRNTGASIRYSYYPSIGHDTWGYEYVKPDFFSWFLARKKNQITVFYEQNLTCPDATVNVRLGLSKTIYPNGRGPGGNLSSGDYGAGPVGNRLTIINYEWARGTTSNVVASGASLNEITVTTAGPHIPGTYYARFQRLDGTWTEWSDPVLVDNSRGPSLTPPISSNGKSTTLPSLDGGTEVLLTGPSSKAVYQWKKDGANIASNGTSVSYTASLPGAYTLISKDPAGSPYQFDLVPTEYRAPTQGCFSLPSNPLSVTTSNGLDVPAPPGNFFVSSNSQNSVVVSWDDRSSNEDGFEIYRSLASGSGYALVTIVPGNALPNPQTYTDNNLQPNTTYYYRMRAVNYSGGSVYTPVASASTALDVVAPSAPVLTIPGTLRSTILLQWSGATDAVGITGYDIYQNGSIIASVNGSTLYYEAKNLVALTSYNYYVRARDLAGNVSPPSNQLAAIARNSGLLYKYYHHPGMASTVEIPSAGVLNKIGFISTFSISPRTQTDNYAFVYEGFINLTSSGNYRFSLETDEGSRMWVNNALVVTNDGVHTRTKVTSASINFTSGWYPIRVEYFENTNTESFTVRWTRPGQNEATIPSSAFTESVANPPGVTAPTNFRATTVAYNQVVLNWNDNSNNETGFEIYRLQSPTGTGTYQVIQVTAAGANTWTDTNVIPETRYYYRIRAISATNNSSLVNLSQPPAPNVAYVTTPAAPAPPAIPAALTATAISATQINLAWGNVSGETGFELQKSSNSTDGFVTISTRPVNGTSYNDVDATGHTTFYYRVRSLGVGGLSSAWSNVASATTPNRSPVFTAIPDQTLLEGSGTAQIVTMSVSDPDNDPITFQFTGLPATHVFTTNQYGQGSLSFTHVAAGTYNIHVEASDGIATVTDDFVLNVGSNTAPVISSLSLDGVLVTPAPITTVQNQSMEAGRVFTMVFTLTDPNGNGQLTAAFPPIISLPPSLTFANSPAPVWNATNRTYTVVFKPAVSQTGFYENIAIQFRDSQGGVNLQTFSLIVNPVDPYFSISINFVGDATLVSPVNYREGDYYETLAPWNNSGPPPSIPWGAFADVLSNMKDDSGNFVKYVKMVSNGSTGAWGGSPLNSDNQNSPNSQYPADPDAVYTSKIRRSYWKVPSNQNATLKFTNLNPSLKYKVTLYGAYPRVDALNPNTLYQVTTAAPSSQQLNLLTKNNTRNVVVSTEQYPTSAGELLINVRGTTSVIGYLNALVLEGKYIENAPPAAPSEVTLEAPLYNRVNVGWQDNSFNEDGFYIYRASTLAGPYAQIGSTAANLRTYADMTATGRTTYYYKVSAFNAFGESALSSHALITTPNGVPVLTNPGTLLVTGGQVLQTNILAVDPENDPMTFSVSGLPSFATLVDNGNGTGFIRFAPTLDDVGPYQLTLNVVDTYSASSEVSFSLVVSDPSVADAFYVNFAPTTSSNAPDPWRVVNSTPATWPKSVLNTTGLVSMLITRSGTWGTSLDNLGVNTGANFGLYPDEVLKSGWVTTQTDLSTTITLGGLDNNKRYNIAILGSRDQFWFANTIYQIRTGTPNGATTDKILNTRKNTDRIVRFTGISPNSGNIVISVRRDGTIESIAGQATPNGTSVQIIHRDASINAMVVESYVPTTLRAPSDLVATATSKNSIRLTWSDNSSSWSNNTTLNGSHGTNETGFAIERAEDPEGPFTPLFTTAANVEFYDNVGLPQNKAYVYRIRSVRTSAPTGQSAYSNVAMASTFDQIIMVNVNSSVADGHVQAASPWNNLSASSSDIGGPQGFLWENFNNATPAPTPLDLRVMYFNTGGGARPNRGYLGAGAIYPDDVTHTAYLFIPGANNSEWRLEDLDPNSAYDLAFFSSEWDHARQLDGSGIEAKKIVTDFFVGPDKKSLYNSKNNTERVFFTNIRPEEDSTIYFQVGGHTSTTESIYNGMLNAFEIRSYTPLNAAFDKIAPSVPQNLVASNLASDSVRLTWSASTDNVGVAGYEIFRGSDLVATVAGTTTLVTGLQPSTTYTFSVRAKDIKGNLSAFSNAIQVTTLSAEGAIAYYPKPTGDLTDVATWGNVVDGTGASPSTFAANNQHFIVNRTASITTALNVTGSNTKLIIEDDVTLTATGTITGLVDVNANATFVVNSATSPELGTLAPTSTITFNGPTNAIPGASYGNLVLDGSTSIKNFSPGTYVVNGDLTLADGVEIKGSVGNGTIVNLLGDLTFEGALTPPLDNQLISLNCSAGQAQSIFMNDQDDLHLFQLRVSNNSTLNLVGGATAKSLTVGSTSGGGGLSIEDGSTLNLGENSLVVLGTGSINAANELGELSVSKADITINSTGAQISNLYFKALSDTLNALHMNANASGQVNIASKMYVNNLVDVTSGRLNSAGNIVLVSSATGTAMVGKIGNTGSILGNVQFQRYMTPKRVYRYMGAPVYNTRVSDWQPYLPVTGPFAGSTGVSSSLYYYDESNGGWIAYPSAGGSNTSTFEMGRGYAIFQYNGTTPSKLQITGPLLQGNFDYTNLDAGSGDPQADDGWNLLSNVYAAPIQWDSSALQTNDISGTVSIRENIDVVNGGFKVWNSRSGGDPDFGGVITQGQAFWVKAVGAAPFIRITEDAKVNVSNAAFYRETIVPENQLSITVKNSALKDRTFLHFATNSSDGIEGKLDALKRDNTYFNLSTRVDGKDLAINSMTLDFCEKSIPLVLRNAGTGHYSFQFDKLETFTFGVEAKLIDHFSQTAVVLSEGSVYEFDITTDAASTGANRFELSLNKPDIDQSITFASTLQQACETTEGVAISLANTQRGVSYSFLRDGNVIATIQGNGSAMNATVSASSLTYGNNVIQLKAQFTGCEATVLPNETTLHYKQLFEPIIHTTNVCEGESALVNASGAPAGAMYQWFESEESASPIFTTDQGDFSTPALTKSKNYFVSVLYNGCESKRNEVVVQVDHLDKPTIEVDGDLLLSSSSEGNQWLRNGEVISGATDATYLPIESGDYAVQVASGSCIQNSDEVEFSILAAENGNGLALNLYPNPVKSKLRITLPDQFASLQEVDISIYNSQGQLAGIYKKRVKNHSLELDVEELSEGLYTLLLDVNGSKVQKRFIRD